MNEERHVPPEGWLRKSLGEMVELNYGKGLPAKVRSLSGKTPVYGSNGVVGRHDKALTGSPVIVIGRKGSVGEIHLASVPCWPIDTTYFVDKFPSGLDATFLFRYLKSQRIGDLDRSTAVPGINREDVYRLSVPLPPLAEQRRIVAKIEALFDQSRTARQALDRVPPLLKKFRQSVLAAAFRGDLTRDWREQSPNVEPASILLEQVRTHRLRHYQEQVKRAKAERQRAPRKLAHLDHSEPAMPNVDELPESWAWATLEFLASPEPRSVQSGPFGSNLHHSEFQDTGVLAVGIDNVLDGRFTIGSQHRISFEKYEQLKKYTARPLDVLITVMATVGRCCFVPEDLETAIITKHVYRISVDRKLCEPSYLMNALRGCPAVQEQLYGEIQGVTRPGINGEILKRLNIPVAPLAEQRVIISRVETLLKQAEAIDAVVEATRRRIDRLEQSILARAFHGDLVPQDPNDEPASALLERVHSERSIGTPSRRLAGYQERKRKRGGKKADV